jgi:hypothetical protein
LTADGATSAWNLNGAVTSSGVIRLTRGATLAAPGVFTNTGTLDLVTAGSAPPAGLTGAGVLLLAGDIPTPAIAQTGGAVQLTLPSLVGHVYQLQRTTDLAAGPWTNSGAPQPGTGAALIFTDTPAPAETRVFYRVVVAP